MRLLGVSSLEELNPSHVTQLTRLVPVSRAATEAADASASRTRTSASRARAVTGNASKAKAVSK